MRARARTARSLDALSTVVRMESRVLGKTGYEISAIGFGAWAIGGAWGVTDDETSMAALDAALDAGVTFFDTADVYGDGHSERLLARLRRERDEPFVVATKMGRRAPLDLAEYTAANFEAWIERSRENLEVDTLDLVQLHCLHPDVYYRPEVFEALDDLVSRGLSAHYGASVDRDEETLKGIESPKVGSFHIIFTMFG